MHRYLSIGELEWELEKDKLSIFPNPTRTEFTVSVDPFLVVEELSVYNSGGKCVWIKHPKEQDDQNIDLSQQPSGVYQLQLKTINGFATRKLIKE